MEFKKLINNFQNCPCGMKHECKIEDIVVEKGCVRRVGEILKKNSFPRKLLVVADKTTIQVSEGILSSLNDFELTLKIYDDLRVASMNEVKEIKQYFDDGIEAVISVGTGSLNDVCRLASAQKDKPLCLFATAPSMDGFASYSAPIVDNNFKITYPAKCPEVIIADTEILAASPVELKSAGFGDMVAKYVALIDWQVSHLIMGEDYCEQVALLTRYAVDEVMKNADKVTRNDEASAKSIFEGLLLTGIAMSFTQTSRPGSGTEHIMSHYIECKELLEGKTPNFHGEDVGVMTLIILKFYNTILKLDNIEPQKEENDWENITLVYGELAKEMLKLNQPDTITEKIDPKKLKDNFEKIKTIIQSVPSYEVILEKMQLAGCKTTISEIGKTEMQVREAFLYHPYMRRRLSLRRLANMFMDIKEIKDNVGL